MKVWIKGVRIHTSGFGHWDSRPGGLRAVRSNKVSWYGAKLAVIYRPDYKDYIVEISCRCKWGEGQQNTND